MPFSELPYEVFHQILEEAVGLNVRDGVTFTYGLSEVPAPSEKPALHRVLRGPLSPEQQRWDGISSIRRVSRAWHDWAINYAMRDVFIRKRIGSERWADLTSDREKYNLYEMIDKPRGTFLYRDPWCSLRKTADIMADYPQIAANVRRLWFNGFYIYETSLRIAATLSSCPNLRSVSVPWTTIRHLSPQQWRRVLGLCNGAPLESLELQCARLPDSESSRAENQTDQQALKSGIVNFGQLRRLKIFGDTTFMPITDEDLEDISRTATNLEVFHISANSSVTIRGVMSIVKSSQSTLRVLDHSPRAQGGFSHPHPGWGTGDEHICDILVNCPRLYDLSISIPSMCANLFSNPQVRWEGDCQVRAAHLCGHESIRTNAPAAQSDLQRLLDGARKLINSSAASVVPRHLYVELFFADCIFEPSHKRVHGDFEPFEIASNGAWPIAKYPSGKGPYGASGFYGKEISMFESIDEDEYLLGVQRDCVSIVT